MRRLLICGCLLGGLLLTGCWMPLPQGPTVLYEEDFSGETSWYVGEDDGKKWWVENGAYHLLTKKSDVFYRSWRTQIGSFGDFQLDVDAQQISGPDDNGYGVVFRRDPEVGFYRFQISGDGWAKFDKFDGSAFVAIRPWERTDLIRQGSASNHITIIANGTQFTFYINGTILYTATDYAFSTGQIGVGGICLDDAGGAHIAFDNVLLQALE